ncbi:MAG: FHA domain-containing protein [Cryobacterium sp.]|nr:FHA domain-containing protein [Cryobacterium sp.]
MTDSARPAGPGGSERIDSAMDNAEGSTEDTVLGSGRIAELPLLDAPDIADADTIIVTRAQSGRRRARDAVASVDDDRERARFALRIGTHEPIPLEVPAYVGRRPSTPRISGSRMPRLVMVPSPTREVSSTHVEFRQEGATVVVTDLGSTNGTIVASGGSSPRGLRQGESVVVGAGSVVDIGDGIRIVVVEAPVEIRTEGSR